MTKLEDRPPENLTVHSDADTIRIELRTAPWAFTQKPGASDVVVTWMGQGLFPIIMTLLALGTHYGAWDTIWLVRVVATACFGFAIAQVPFARSITIGKGKLHAHGIKLDLAAITKASATDAEVQLSTEKGPYLLRLGDPAANHWFSDLVNQELNTAVAAK